MTRSALMLAVFLAAACSGVPVVTPVPTSGTSLPTGVFPTVSRAPADSSLEPTASEGPILGTEIELIVSGGPFDGSYRAVTQASDACMRDVPATTGLFRVAYVDSAAPDGFTSLRLEVRDPAAAEKEDTDNFSLSIQIERPIGPGQYSIDPVIGQGDGAVLMETTPGGGVTLDVSGQTVDGIDIEATIICDSVADG